MSLVFLCCCSTAAGRVVAPAGDSLSFASPKESKQRKGDPAVRVPALRFGQPAVLAFRGVRANSPSAQTARGPDPRKAPLLGAHRRAGCGEVGPLLRSADAGANASYGAWEFQPLCVRRAAQQNEDQRDACLSRRRVCGQPSFCEQRRLPRERSGRGRRQWGRLFFAYFLLAKQKKVRPPPGGFPGQQLQPNSTVKADPEGFRHEQR